MDGSYYKNASNHSVFLVMDNDSGYVSNNLDQESNSDSTLDNSNTSTVDILKSFLPKPVFLNEDALLERPDINQIFTREVDCENHPHSHEFSEYSPDLVIDSSVKSGNTGNGIPSFSSFQTDNDMSDSSLIVPITEPIYFDLNTKTHSSSVSSDHGEMQFFGFEKVSTEVDTMVFKKIEKVEQNIESNVIGNDLTTTNDEERKTFVSQKSDVELEQPINITDNMIVSVSTQNSKVPILNSNMKQSIHDLAPRIYEFGKDVLRNNCENNVLSNVTNICGKTDKSNISPEKKCKITVRRRTNSCKDKENVSQQTEVFKTPSKGIKRKFSQSGSPDLFSDDESSKLKPMPSPKILEERFVHKLDHILIKRVQRDLSGVPPPPDFTITKFTVDDILKKLQENKNLFWTKDNLTSLDDQHEKSLNRSKNSSFGSGGSILIEGEFQEVTSQEFPKILYSRHHGLHFNRNKLSEEIEHLCDKYAKRYIGAETQSTCCAVGTKYLSPAKRKAIKQKWASKSPGRRLSHLARRRITFSSANLQANSSNAASRARQILIDYKKLELLNHKKSPRKTPRKTPNKSPSQGRTPSSSAKKKLRLRFRLLSGDFKEGTAGPSSSIAGSKRALFQSPDSESKFRNILSNSSTSSCSSFASDLNSRGTKRSLFPSPNRIGCRTSLFSSPKKKSPFKSMSHFEKKRKRDDGEDLSNPPKFFRSQSSDVRLSSENEHGSHSGFSRTKSEGVLPSSQPLVDLSAAHKKKLQWAVYESLKLQNISTSHAQFKAFASVLARVTRRFILSTNVRLEGGTSERMLRIARHHSFAVVKGKSVEEIMSEYNKNKARNSKPQGYIAPEDYHQRSQSKESSVNKENVFKDRSVDSVRNSNARSGVFKVESRIDRIRKVINFEDNR